MDLKRMMRNPAILAWLAAFVALPAASQSLEGAEADDITVQSFEDMVQSSLDETRVGSSLSPEGGQSFAAGEVPSPEKAFDRPAPAVRLEGKAAPDKSGKKPAIEIAGAKVTPDIKKKGLKVAIPVETIGAGQAALAPAETSAD